MTSDSAGAPDAQPMIGLNPAAVGGLIFDCDGVLFDSKDANSAFYNHIRAELGLAPMDPHEAAWAHMASTKEVLERMAGPERLEEAKDITRRTSYSANFMPLMRPEPGMREFLRAAQDAGIRLALCTNRSDSVHRVLQHFELSCFDPVVTVTQAPPKPDPAGLLSILDVWGLGRKDVGYVGDSLVDQQAGDAAGIPFIAFRSPELRAALHVGDFAGLFRAFFPAGTPGTAV